MPTDAADLPLRHHATPAASAVAQPQDGDALLARCTALEIILEAALIALGANPQAVAGLARQSATRLRAAAAFTPGNGNAAQAMAIEDQVARITRNLALQAAPAPRHRLAPNSRQSH